MFVSKNDRQDKSLIGQVHDQAGHCPLTCRYFEPCQLAGGKPIWAISKSGFKELNSGLPRTNPAGGQAKGGELELRASELQVQRSTELLGHAATAN